MGLSNLPPGVTDNMIPGNRKEDEAYDNLCGQIAVLLGESKIPEEAFTNLVEWVSVRLGEANSQGYNQGVQETKANMCQAAELLGLGTEFAKIDKTSHEI